MLSRVADSIYWMNRQIERAENVARAVETALDLALEGSIAHGRLWNGLVCTFGDQADFWSRHGLADQAHVIAFLAFDTQNPNSIASCLHAARENARTVRDMISSPMWQEINKAYLFVRAAGAGHAELHNPREFLDEVKRASQLITGATDATMSHGEAWHFARLGRLIERADKTSRVLDVEHYFRPAAALVAPPANGSGPFGPEPEDAPGPGGGTGHGRAGAAALVAPPADGSGPFGPEPEDAPGPGGGTGHGRAGAAALVAPPADGSGPFGPEPEDAPGPGGGTGHGRAGAAALVAAVDAPSGAPPALGPGWDSVQWSAVLESASALEMYRKEYGAVSRRHVAEFLILDRAFPRAMHFCLIKAEESLLAVTGGTKGTFSNAAEQRLGRLRSELDYGQIDEILEADSGLHGFIDGFQTRLNRASEAIHETFFAAPAIDAASVPAP